MAADGRYYNMRGADISDFLAKFDLFFERSECPTIGIGDAESGRHVGESAVVVVVIEAIRHRRERSGIQREGHVERH